MLTLCIAKAAPALPGAGRAAAAARAAPVQGRCCRAQAALPPGAICAHQTAPEGGCEAVTFSGEKGRAVWRITETKRAEGEF